MVRHYLEEFRENCLYYFYFQIWRYRRFMQLWSPVSNFRIHKKCFHFVYPRQFRFPEKCLTFVTFAKIFGPCSFQKIGKRIV